MLYAFNVKSLYFLIGIFDKFRKRKWCVIISVASTRRKYKKINVYYIDS